MNRFYMFYYRPQFPGDNHSLSPPHPLCEEHGKRLKKSVESYMSVRIVKGKKTDENCQWCRSPKDFKILARVHLIDLK